MKNKELRNMKLKMLGTIILAGIVSIGITFFLIYFVFDGVLNSTIAETTYAINHKLYYFLLSNKNRLIAILFIIDGIICTYFVISKNVDNIGKIIESINKAYQGKEDTIQLPKEFTEVAMQLNEIKYNSLKNEKMAKEAEARKNDLIVYMAHDLKTPLTSVIGYLALLKEEEKLPKELQKKYIGISLEKAERLEELINEFFEITRYNVQNLTIEKKTVDFTFLLNQVIDEFYPLLAPKELKFKCSIEKELTIKGDANKLARVLDNLIRNAISYSEKKTEIVIQAEEKEEKILIQVKNTGEKIPDNKLNHIFEKFYRLDAARTTESGGAGLGLAITKEIVELHGGTISAESTEKETVFTVELPK